MPTSYQMPLFSGLPVAFTHGQGVWLWDTKGNKYLDALAGIAVCGLGHAHPAVTAALCDQAGKLLHTSNWYEIPLQEQLAERLCRLAGMENVFFCNSGAEANEAAIKLARLHGHQRDILTPGIIVTEGSFHGRTLATLSASGSRKIQSGFEPLVQGFYRVPYNDLSAVQQIGERNKNIVAVLVEPITGEGGVFIPDEGYLKGLRKICDERGWLLMLDEIQTGMCRTGKWFACQHEGVAPDVMTLAKGLGNGVPIGACLARGKAAKVFKPGSHGSTFSGNPLVCRVALAVIEELEKKKFADRAAKVGKRLLDKLKEKLNKTPGVKEIRGRGLMLAIELERPCKELLQRGLESGILINVTADNVIRLLPPLILTDTEADLLADILEKMVRGFLNEK
ncbi:MAG: aspartate aminotransferase family protein [Gammaproteobacteria bacterium]|nr:aspartate aminotransferase family protein [Gammaproteobacteria bacterium]MDH3370779.1 aspartate aminotransferase family protein [Gammaproteobacteria bacterium]MDH3406127.1 aspartate aminotransferase family protein [Gammaproteobacteria bacterium]MDH3563237.1 aspartate aminotransferase family protein [Gammaproteobacteria bacterium]MDH5486411.1 aspartate aminotransferase family protein [Gammaproteobacteria bacterium]